LRRSIRCEELRPSDRWPSASPHEPATSLSWRSRRRNPAGRQRKSRARRLPAGRPRHPDGSATRLGSLDGRTPDPLPPSSDSICEAHPWLPWPHHQCLGPGMPASERATLHEPARVLSDRDQRAFWRLLFAVRAGDAFAVQAALRDLKHHVADPVFDDRGNDASPCLGCGPSPRARPGGRVDPARPTHPERGRSTDGARADTGDGLRRWTS
jgi:hypothetical protein